MTAKSEGRVRLTKAQAALLKELCERDAATIAPGYPPAAKLEALGLIALRDGRYGQRIGTPTPAGRRALETSHED